MSPFLEFEGKGVDKAVEKACKKLNTPKDRLKYDVISYGSSGIFGLVGVKQAKIRVYTNGKNDSHSRKRKTEPKPRPVKETEPLTAETQDTKIESQQNLVSDDQQSDDLRPPSAASADPEREKIINECIELGTQLLQKIINAITSDADVIVEPDGDRILFNVNGGNAAVLIGKKGQTLEAIQYLVEKAVNKHSESRIRIQVDIEGYLKKRRKNLQSMAERLAQKAKKMGKPITIGQLNAHDRRIIHLTLKDDHSVRTQSMGDGFYRKLVVFPKRSRSGKKKSR